MRSTAVYRQLAITVPLVNRIEGLHLCREAAKVRRQIISDLVSNIVLDHKRQHMKESVRAFVVR